MTKLTMDFVCSVPVYSNPILTDASSGGIVSVVTVSSILPNANLPQFAQHNSLINYGLRTQTSSGLSWANKTTCSK